MAHPVIQSGDVGTAIVVTLEDEDGPLDVSDATTMELLFELPDTSTVLYTAEFYSDGTDGKVQYVSAADDFATPGKWKVQSHIITPTGEWWSSISVFWVKENLTVPTP